MERENLIFSTHLKRFNLKTIGYSTSIEMYDEMMGLFIERAYYI
ncbi:IS1 family transposase [Candidatus Enterovibrio escicola]